MRSFRTLYVALFVVTFGLFAHAAPAEAFQRTIRAIGTSSGVGTATIIIESFGLVQGATAPSSILVSIPVAIPSGSTPSNTATLIRSDVDAALGADYTVIALGGDVLIDRSVGSFTMSITENVPGQTIEEVPATGGKFRQAIVATEAKEVPAPPSPSGGTASGSIVFDVFANTITYDIHTTGMSGTVTAAHIHAYASSATGGAPVKIGFTLTSPGRFTGVASYPDTAEANLLGGSTYLNVHTTNNPGGQVRDQLNRYGSAAVPGLTPVGAGVLALALAAGGAWVMVRRRKSTA